ncbi:MAG: hypothetical protein JW920_10625 [Deltaproteobacteria bacterium]|nr:hypothetical protein [Deltaproteobacteria bacterium]
MREREIRTQIDQTVADLVVLKKELKIRLDVIKENALTGVKVAAIALAGFFALRITVKCLWFVLRLLWRYKLVLPVMAGFPALIYMYLNTDSGT